MNSRDQLSLTTFESIPKISFQREEYILEDFMPALLLSTVQSTELGAVVPTLLLATYREYVATLTQTKQCEVAAKIIDLCLDGIDHGEDSVADIGMKSDKNDCKVMRNAILESQRYKQILQTLEDAKMRLTAPEHIRNAVHTVLSKAA